MLSEIGRQMIFTEQRISQLEIKVEMLRIEKAKYKAYFFQKKNNLAERLNQQLCENNDNLVGDFDGCSYSSRRANAIFRTLEDMLEEGIITAEEYQFCE